LDGTPRQCPRHGLDAIRRWNQISIDASGLDHTRPGPLETRTWREQLGPGRASRAISIVHIAMFDALNAIVGGFKSYTGVQVAPGPLSMEAAISQAAHDTLSALFTAQVADCDARLAEDLAGVNNDSARPTRREWGTR